jgi:hypothetical protein
MAQIALLYPSHGRRPRNHRLKMTALLLHRGVGRLIQDTVHILIALGRTAAVVLFGTLL